MLLGVDEILRHQLKMSSDSHSRSIITTEMPDPDYSVLRSPVLLGQPECPAVAGKDGFPNK